MPRPARDYRVLIVDDNYADHQLFELAISELALPIKLVSCLTAEVALDLLAEDAGFDLVLTDLYMPRMSGAELCATIKAHPEWKKIPTIIMSSKPKKLLPSTFLEKCRSSYFVKPSSWRDYIDLIRDVHIVLRDGTGRGSGRYRAERSPAPV